MPFAFRDKIVDKLKITPDGTIQALKPKTLDKNFEIKKAFKFSFSI